MDKGGKHRHFSREFKMDAVQLVTEKKMSVRKVAEELDIHPNLLHLWKRKYLKEGEKAFHGKGQIAPEKAEIRKLRKELERVKEERDILKKALSNQQLCYKELQNFIKIKMQLGASNDLVNFFKHDAFKIYLNTLEQSVLMRYFLKRQHFKPKIYGDYLKIKKQIHFKLPIKTDIFIFVKCMLFFKTIKK